MPAPNLPTHNQVRDEIARMLRNSGATVTTELRLPNGYIADIYSQTIGHQLQLWEIKTNSTPYDIGEAIDKYSRWAHRLVYCAIEASLADFLDRHLTMFAGFEPWLPELYVRTATGFSFVRAGGTALLGRRRLAEIATVFPLRVTDGEPATPQLPLSSNGEEGGPGAEGVTSAPGRLVTDGAARTPS